MLYVNERRASSQSEGRQHYFSGRTNLTEPFEEKISNLFARVSRRLSRLAELFPGTNQCAVGFGRLSFHPILDFSIESKAVRKTVPQRVHFVGMRDAVSLEPQSENLSPAAFGVSDIFRGKAKGLVVGIVVPPEAQWQGRLRHHHRSDLLVVKQRDGDRTGHAVPDDADGLLTVPFSDLLHHPPQPVYYGSASLRGDAPFTAGEKLQ